MASSVRLNAILYFVAAFLAGAGSVVYFSKGETMRGVVLDLLAVYLVVRGLGMMKRRA